MNKTIWKQADSRWGKKPYPTSDCTMSGAGCGCVACTHIAMEQDRYANWTPENLRSWMVSQGFAIRNQGTTYSGMTKTLQHIGHSNVVVVGTADPMSKVWTEFNKGNRIGIILFRGGSYNGVRWTNSGHYVAVTDYKIQNGKHYFYCKDSGGRNHDGWYSYENSMKGLVYMVWIVSKINPKATTTTTSNGKLAVDGSGGKATVTRLQEFLGVNKTGGITIVKEHHKYCKSLKAIEYGKAGSATVKALQKWLGISQDGDWGVATSKALQKKLGVTQDGYFGPNSMKALQKYLNSNTKAVYPTPAPKDRFDKANDWAVEFCKSENGKYRVFTDDPLTQDCPLCNPKAKKGTNCILAAFMYWRHGAGILCRCNAEVINDSMGDRLLRSNYETALALVKRCVGINDVTLISNGGKAIPVSKLKKGDIIMYFDGDTYAHMGVHIGGGKLFDCARGHSPQMQCGKLDVDWWTKTNGWPVKLAIRYTGK